MKLKKIEQMIAELDIEKQRKVIPGYMPLAPFTYQWVAFAETAKVIRDYQHPMIVEAAVSAGKTVMISMVAMRLRAANWDALVLSRSGAIVDQDSEEMANFKIPNPKFCASLNTKYDPRPAVGKSHIITGSEGTVVNGLTKELSNFVPKIILADECHEIDPTDIIASELAGEETLEDMVKAGRKNYTKIIREFQSRCREKFGKELIIIGYTGTPYRGRTPIINEDLRSPGFWRGKIVSIDTDYLVKFGSVVPTHFGAVAERYDLSEWSANEEHGASDFSLEQLKAMQQKILSDGTLTQRIMMEVQTICANRNGVLVTCAGRKHCEEAAAALLPGTTYGIITQETPEEEEIAIMKAAKAGECKYVFQVQKLTTGVNCPPWDTIVFLRKIMSLTLVVQLIGRGMRQLKKHHIEAGLVKEDNLVLDYTGTMEELGHLYFSAFLEQYQYETAIAAGDPIPCEKCGQLNSRAARRCIGEDPKSPDGRCEYFFCKPAVCSDIMHPRIKDRVTAKGCGALNDPAARFCRLCDNQLIDPNLKLSGTNYTLDDYCAVVGFDFQLSRCGKGIAVEYQLIDPESGDQFKAWEIHWPFLHTNRGAKAAWRKFVSDHAPDKQLSSQLLSCKTAPQLMEYKDQILSPSKVTHRKIGNGRKDAITRKVFEIEF